MKTLILGIGNRIMRDDAVGVLVADELGRQVDADVLTGTATGLVLLDCLSGYERAIIVDATQTGEDEPGTVRHRDVGSTEINAAPTGAHDLGVEGMLAWARRNGHELPSAIEIYTVEAEDLSTIGEGLSPRVQAALPHVIQRVLREQFPSSKHPPPAPSPGQPAALRERATEK